MITLIRSLFPLKDDDKRRENIAESSIKQLQQLTTAFAHTTVKLSAFHKKTLLDLLETLQTQIHQLN